MRRGFSYLLGGGLAALTIAVTGLTPAIAGVMDRPFLRARSVVIVFGASDFEENGGEAPVVYDFYLLNPANSGTIGSDLIAADGRAINYNTGQYNPIQSGTSSGWEYQINDAVFGGGFTSAGPHQTLDANDSYAAFGLDDSTDIDLLGGGSRASRFFVASNAPFDLYAQASNLNATGDFSTLDYSNIRYRLRINRTGGGGATRWGNDAQNPSVGGDGIVIGGPGPVRTLDDLSAGPTRVFGGGQRTARRRGSIMSQAVSFQSRYDLRGAGITGNNYDFSQGVGTLAADVTYTIYTP